MRAEDRREPTNEELYYSSETGVPLEPSPPLLPPEKVPRESPESIKSMVITIGIMLLLCYSSAVGLVLRHSVALALPGLAGLLFALLMGWVTRDYIKEWRQQRTRPEEVDEPTLITPDTTTKSWREWPLLKRVTKPKPTKKTDLGDVLFAAGLTAVSPLSTWSAMLWASTGQWPYAVLPWITTGVCSVLFVAMLVAYLAEQLNASPRRSRSTKKKRRSR